MSSKTADSWNWAHRTPFWKKKEENVKLPQKGSKIEENIVEKILR